MSDSFTGLVKNFTRSAGYGIRSILPIFKSKMFVSQSKAKLAEKMWFGRITHYLDPEIRQMLVSGMFGGHSPSWSMVYLLLELEFYA